MSQNTIPGERLTEATGSLEDLVDAHNFTGAAQWLSEHADHVIADELARIPPDTAALAFRMLAKDDALEVFEELEPPDQQRLLEGMRGPRFVDIVEGMDPDDRARMLREAPAKVAKRVLAGLSAEEHQMTAALLGYPDDSAGRYMTPEVVALPENLTVARALQVVRSKGTAAETVYTLPVVDTSRRLRGIAELRELVLAHPETMVSDLVETAPAYVYATDPAEDAARLMRETNTLNMPVVDSEQRLVGLLTFDDAAEVLEEAESEDIALQGGSSPWEGHYMSVGVFRLAGNRAVWLSLLLVAATLTVSVTQAFEATLAQVAALALFIPMLIGAGGNAGAQAATSCVRALAVGEVRTSDLWRIIWREARVGLLLGAMLAVLGLGIGALFVDFPVALVVGISLILICSWAATIGGTMPLLARKLGIDPAVVSAPMVTTLVDATGLVIYFVTARVVLGI